jgi:predicted RNA-binding Zn-ribbon protein involved in translation (DUF1610 family)
MGSPEEHDVEASVARTGARVYVPCPACGSAVLLGYENRASYDPDSYDCPSCDARLYLVEP